jgi:hypothetical protein
MAHYTFTYDPKRTLIPVDRACFICEGDNPDMVCGRQADDKHPAMTAYAHDVCVAQMLEEQHRKAGDHE